MAILKAFALATTLTLVTLSFYSWVAPLSQPGF